MIHNLKTLYVFVNRHYPDLDAKFEHLEDYCLNDSKRHAPGTLGGMIYALRHQISQKDIERVFYYALVEALLFGEDALYSDMQNFKVWFEYRDMLKKINHFQPLHKKSECLKII